MRTLEFIHYQVDTNKVRTGKKLEKRPCSLFCAFFNTKICLMNHYHLRQGGGHNVPRDQPPVLTRHLAQRAGFGGTSAVADPSPQPQDAGPCGGPCAGGLGARAGCRAAGERHSPEGSSQGDGPRCAQGTSQLWFAVSWLVG